MGLSYRYVENEKKYLNFLPSFVADKEVSCGMTIGTIEPLDYPATYEINQRSTVIDIENDVTHSE